MILLMLAYARPIKPVSSWAVSKAIRFRACSMIGPATRSGKPAGRVLATVSMTGRPFATSSAKA